MVDEITPTYYAAQSQQMTYELTGFGFEMLPDNALGIRSTYNNNPLVLRDSTDDFNLYEIIEKSNTRIVLSCLSEQEKGTSAYLGCIISNDRNIVYWVNNSQPLPRSRGDIVDPQIIEKR